MRMRRSIKLIGVTLIAVSLFGCATVSRRAVPLEMMSKANVEGMCDIRAFSGSPSEVFKNDYLDLLEQTEKKSGFAFLSKLLSETKFDVLAISGGAANGAYGAGLLNGWTKQGTRPEFKIVTGISTGAIIAPFAFLGSKYDGKLEEFYTRYSTKDVISPKLSKNSLASTRPLQRIIAKYIDKEVLSEIANEYRKGRRLYIGTTNLDAQQLVIWDMGKIAVKGNDEALDLFRRVILASASIPIAFPPVYFKVEVGGEEYDEMHVDGGVTKQVFFLYDVLIGMDKALKAKRIDMSKVKYSIYVIRNGYSDPVWQEIRDEISSIAERTLDTMTNAQSTGDLYQLYLFTSVSNGDFNLAYIPSTSKWHSKELFDKEVMKKLFDLGFAQAEKGYAWQKVPPGFDPEIAKKQ